MPARKKVDRDEFARLHNEGLTQKELAEYFGVNPATLWRIQRILGLESPARRMTPERQARIQLMLDDGWPWKEIERTEGANWDTMRRHFPGTAWTHTHAGHMVAATRDVRPRLGNKKAT